MTESRTIAVISREAMPLADECARRNLFEKRIYHRRLADRDDKKIEICHW